ncbi:Lrp/AsnC family transcriptional regulator, regulator for asnA, asnC and gidA/Lrp/AsnC family transcriptional regulator, leucine-responsive regulatory protein [Sinosporangium album]|uniref:Lrp/AsnC family transcriptional regulator, regulator for asnA, asnC and gidA/Lrp/AsnC family transcriptional regulator, leucine-responsive regulatory protein n=1 Tax=Sinosporangium album TaxID=504805 RepID=A0A1G8E2E3_9ACTN|nr:Lrp/AsnC family transcriptional regulator [Sinosporangium album]SDH64106.1 Lrp/AsnC family transcriptional regulator, regulator for asnA, asnC and gidA/Lrp/AsnC family transcriptional regulator, leucine-responsive regulatory protein [Sinosporangium album]
MKRTRTASEPPSLPILDEIDRRILSILMRDGRTRNCDLAKDVRLGDSAVAARIRRLSDAGVLAAIRAHLNPAALGRPVEAVVRVRLKPGTVSAHFEERLRTVPAVLDALVLAGDVDAEVRVACRDLADLEDTLAALRRIGADHTHTDLVIRSVGELGATVLSD